MCSTGRSPWSHLAGVAGGRGKKGCGVSRRARDRQRRSSRGVRADPAAGRRGGAERARRHAPVQGRDRRRASRCCAATTSTVPAHETGLRRDPRSVRPRRAGRRGHRRRRADQARRARAASAARPTCTRCIVLGADRRQRRLLRADRRASGPSCAGSSTAGTRIVQLGYATDGGDVDDIVNAAQAEVYAVTERRTSEDYLPLSAIIEGTIDEIEASSHRGDGLTGVPTGFADLDRLTNGLHPGQMIVVAARPAVGKALALDTPLAHPGWLDHDGRGPGRRPAPRRRTGCPTRVVAATEVMTDRPVLRGRVLRRLGDRRRRAAPVADARRAPGVAAGVRAGPNDADIAAYLRYRTAARLNHSVTNAPLSSTDRPARPPYVSGPGSATADDRTRSPQHDPELVRVSRPRASSRTPLLPCFAAARARLRVAVRSCAVWAPVRPETAQIKTADDRGGERVRRIRARTSCPDCGRRRRARDVRPAARARHVRPCSEVGVLGDKHIRRATCGRRGSTSDTPGRPARHRAAP